MGKQKDYRRFYTITRKTDKKVTKDNKSSTNLRHCLTEIEALLEEEMDLAFWRKKLDKYFRRELDRYPLLAKATYLGCERAVDDLLDAGEDVNVQIPDGSTPLIIAVERGHISILQKLLKKGADLRLSRKNGINAIMIAVSKCDNKSFSILWDHVDKTDNWYLKQADSEGHTLLTIAAERGFVDYAKFFAGLGGVDVDRPTAEGKSALMLAAMRGQQEIVQCLLEAEANILLEDKAGATALCVTFAQEQWEVMDMLLKALNNKDRDIYVKKRVELLFRSRLNTRMETMHFYKKILFRVLWEIKRTMENGTELLLKHKVFFVLVRCLDSYQCDTELLRIAFHLSASLMYDDEDDGYVLQDMAKQCVEAKGPDFSLKTMSNYHTDDTIDLRCSAFLPIQAGVHCPVGKNWLKENYCHVVNYIAEFRSGLTSLKYWVKGESAKTKAMFEKFEGTMLSVAKACELHEIKSKAHQESFSEALVTDSPCSDVFIEHFLSLDGRADESLSECKKCEIGPSTQSLPLNTSTSESSSSNAVKKKNAEEIQLEVKNAKSNQDSNSSNNQLDVASVTTTKCELQTQPPDSQEGETQTRHQEVLPDSESGAGVTIGAHEEGPTNYDRPGVLDTNLSKSSTFVKKKLDGQRKLKNIKFHTKFDQNVSNSSKIGKMIPQNANLSFVRDLPSVRNSKGSSHTGYADALKKNLNSNSENEIRGLPGVIDGLNSKQQQFLNQDVDANTSNLTVCFKESSDEILDHNYNLNEIAGSSKELSQYKKQVNSLTSKFFSFLSHLYPYNQDSSSKMNTSTFSSEDDKSALNSSSDSTKSAEPVESDANDTSCDQNFSIVSKGESLKIDRICKTSSAKRESIEVKNENSDVKLESFQSKSKTSLNSDKNLIDNEISSDDIMEDKIFCEMAANLQDMTKEFRSKSSTKEMKPSIKTKEIKIDVKATGSFLDEINSNINEKTVDDIDVESLNSTKGTFKKPSGNEKTNRRGIVSKILNQNQAIASSNTNSRQLIIRQLNEELPNEEKIPSRNSESTGRRTYSDVARTNTEHVIETVEPVIKKDNDIELHNFFQIHQDFPELEKVEATKVKFCADKTNSKDILQIEGNKEQSKQIHTNDLNTSLETGDASHHSIKNKNDNSGKFECSENDNPSSCSSINDFKTRSHNSGNLSEIQKKNDLQMAMLRSGMQAYTSDLYSMNSIIQRLLFLEDQNLSPNTHNSKLIKLQKYAAFYHRLMTRHMASRRLQSTPLQGRSPNQSGQVDSDNEHSKKDARCAKKVSIFNMNLRDNKTDQIKATETTAHQLEDADLLIPVNNMNTEGTPKLKTDTAQRKTLKLTPERSRDYLRKVARGEALRKRRSLLEDAESLSDSDYLDPGYTPTFIYCEAGSRWFPVLKGLHSCMPLANHLLNLHSIETNGSRVRSIECAGGKVVFGSKLEPSLKEGSYGSYIGLLSKGGIPVVVRKSKLATFDEDERVLALSRKQSIKHKSLTLFYDAIVNPLDFKLYLIYEHCEYSIPEFLKATQKCKFSPSSFYKKLMIYEFVEAVRYLHVLQIVHGFIKPTNVMVTIDHRVKLTDYFLLGITPVTWGVRVSDAKNRPIGTTISSFCWRPTEVIGAKSEKDARASITVASDIQMVGMVVYYIISGGKHPFGSSEAECQENIKLGTPVLGPYPSDIECRDLVSETVKGNEESRLSICSIIKHPYFWDIEKRFQFLLCVGRKIEFYTSKPTRTAEEFRESCIEARDWTFYIPRNLMDYISTCMNKTYTDDFPDLLQFSIALQENFDGMPRNFICIVQHPSRYILATFPTLFMSTYYVIRRSSSLQKQMALQSFF